MVIPLNPRAEKRFNFHYYLDQPVKRDSNIKAKSFEAPRYIGLDEEIGSHYFNANFYSGGGWKLWQNQHKKYNLMVDNLWVRGTMTIWEMVINQLRASNGTVIISSCAKTKEDGAVLAAGTSYHLWFDSGDNTSVDMQPFAVNDIIMARRFNMPNDGDTPTTLLEIYGTVTAISVDGENNKITFDTAGSPSTPLNKGVLEFVRIGNTSDASRQGSIVLTSDGIDSDLGGGGTGTVPYIDVYAGVDSRAKFMDKDYVVVRLGRLDEITGNTDEFGLWTNNIYLTGSAVGASASYSGTAAERDAFNAANPGVLKEGDRWSVTNENNNLYIWESGAWVDRVDDMIRTNGIGLIDKAPAPSGSGLYLGSTYLGFYTGSTWTSYIDNASNAVFGSVNQRIEILGASGEIRFYDNIGDERILFDSSVGSGNYAGIFVNNGTIQVKPTTNATSGFAFEAGAYSISNSHTQLGFRSEFATDNTVNAWLIGSDIVNYYARVKLVGGSMDAVGYQSDVAGTSSGTVSGAIFAGRNVGVRGTSSGGYGGSFDTVHIDGILSFDAGTTSADGLLWGSDVTLYRKAANVLKTDDNFYVAQQLRFDAGTTTADGLLWGSDVTLYRVGANILKTDDRLDIALNCIIGGDLFVAGASSGGGAINFAGVGVGNGLEFNGDTNLYRSTANTLKTDDNFLALQSIKAGTNLSAGSLSSAGLCVVILENLPTAPPPFIDQVWNDSGTLKIT